MGRLFLANEKLNYTYSSFFFAKVVIFLFKIEENSFY